MANMETAAFFEAAPRMMPRPAENRNNATAAHSANKPENEDAAGSFSSLLIEQQERPEKPLAGQKNAPQKVDATEGEKAAAVVAKGETTLEEQTSAGLVKAVPTVGVEVPDSAAAISTTAVKAETATPTVIAQGLAVQAQAPANVANPAVQVAEAKLNGQTASNLTDQIVTADTGKGTVSTVPAAAAATPATPTAAAKPLVLPTPEINTGVNTAAELESAVKGKATYQQAPVVSESQIVADSLKNETKAQAATVDTSVASTPTAGTAEPAMALDVALGDSGQTGNEGQPTVETEAVAEEANTEPAPATEATTGDIPLPAEMQNTNETVVEVVAPQPTTEAEAEATATAAADLNTMNRSADSTVSSSASQPTTDPVLARDIRQQVVRQFSSQLMDLDGQEKMIIKLNPENLGQVELTFEAKDDRLMVVIAASSREAEGALRENMNELTDRIVERSARFSHVDVRVDIRDSGDSRQDAKQDQKQDGRQEQKREQERQGNGQHGQGQQGRQAQKAWESAMSWQLAEQAANEEG